MLCAINRMTRFKNWQPLKVVIVIVLYINIKLQGNTNPDASLRNEGLKEVLPKDNYTKTPKANSPKRKSTKDAINPLNTYLAERERESRMETGLEQIHALIFETPVISLSENGPP